MKMKEYIGKICHIHVKTPKNDLFYTAKILSTNNSHISFIDKFGQMFCFKIDCILEISCKNQNMSNNAKVPAFFYS